MVVFCSACILEFVLATMAIDRTLISVCCTYPSRSFLSPIEEIVVCVLQYIVDTLEDVKSKR